jgi:double-stranded uracil-DNA glycosylase
MALPLIIDKRTEVLILGSYPGVVSLSKMQYYANPGNDFWRIMSIVLDADLVPMDYKDRLKLLLKNRIGLWDVYDEVERQGSMDHDIKNAKLNDFSILKGYQELRKILITGRKAYDDFSKAALSMRQHHDHHYIPSPSGSNRRISLADKAKKIKDLIR